MVSLDDHLLKRLIEKKKVQLKYWLIKDCRQVISIGSKKHVWLCFEKIKGRAKRCGDEHYVARFEHGFANGILFWGYAKVLGA